MERLALPLASHEKAEDVGLLGRSSFYPSLRTMQIPILLRLPSFERLLSYPIASQARLVAQPITFTPFASTQPCSARCVFCSETLRHKKAKVLSATLRPSETYFEGLQEALRQLRRLPLSFSLSGLEATDQAAWLESLLDVLQEHESDGGKVEEKILYTNAAGLARETTGGRLLPRLRAFDLTRAEVSRHHHTQEKNDAIMRFRPTQAIREQAVFEQSLQDILAVVPVRLVCVLQTSGIASTEAVWSYVRWAEALGIRDIVFREFSRLHDEYLWNATSRLIEAERVGQDGLLQALFEEGLPSGTTPVCATAGYYFWNLRLQTDLGTFVTFETSDYKEMKARHRSGVIYKFVYHADGRLCADWDPESEILWQAPRVSGFK